MRWRPRVTWASLAGLVLAAVAATFGSLAAGLVPADWGAGAILHPWRRPLTVTPDLPFRTVRILSNDGVPLEGWLFEPPPAPAVPKRVLIVYLHGIADNRQSSIGVAQRLVPRGHRVLAFDGRAHGRSGGAVCSYGVRERHDLGRALDAIGAPRAVLIGHSLGAAVALQAAAVDARVGAVVAASPFSDLGAIVHDRARRLLLPRRFAEASLARAGELGRFATAEASPLALAPRIRVPVLLLHGASDGETPPEHSRRIAAALGRPPRLALLPGVGHDEILGRPEAWREILAFLDGLPSGADAALAGEAP